MKRRLITRDDAAALAGISVSTFAAYVARGENGAPKPAEHVGRTPLYKRTDVERWVARRNAKTATDAASSK